MAGPRIVVIGAGNVASHLARALDARAEVVQVIARSADHAASLASALRGASHACSPADAVTDADFYLIAVSDDSIASVAASLPAVRGVVVHTSGSVGLDALSCVRAAGVGVFYPLQTFSKSVPVDVAEVPFFLEASDEAVLIAIRTLALSLSPNVYEADSRQRMALHIAAVFGCNFFNHLLGVSQDILAAEGYSLSVLLPLLRVTLAKAMDVGPHNAQTGPAARGDTGVIHRHLQALSPAHRRLYALLSESIMNASSHSNPLR